MGITLFLASLTMLFAGSLVAVVWVRISADQWPPAGAPALPRLLWLSTALLIGSSATIHSALVSIRRGDQQGLQYPTKRRFGQLHLQRSGWSG